MTIKGGIISNHNSVELSISIGGGKPYKRVFNDIVNVAINKFVIISTALCKILIDKTTPQDVTFYIKQIKLLFQRAHVELIPGDLPYHQKYNMWLLDGYVRMLLETNDMKLISQLLNLDSILYSIEESGATQNTPLYIDFDVPSNLNIITILDIDSDTEVSTPATDELNSYLHSFNNNLMILTSLIIGNKDNLKSIHNHIIKIGSNYLS